MALPIVSILFIPWIKYGTNFVSMNRLGYDWTFQKLANHSRDSANKQLMCKRYC